MPSQFDFIACSEQQVSELFHTHDWSNSPLGPIESWPQELQFATGIMLTSHHPMCLAWGGDLCLLYNDAYSRFLGARHPQAFAQSFSEVWADVWDYVGPLVARAMSGESVWMEDMHLVIFRNGYAEDTWWNFCYSPLRSAGRVSGMFNICTDSTEKFLAERAWRETEARQAFLLKLGDQLRPLADPVEIQATAMRVLGQHLRLSRAQYFEMDPTGEYAQSLGSYVQDVAPRVGRYRLDDFGPFVKEAYQLGHAFIVADTAIDPRVSDKDRISFDASGFRSCVGVPLLKEGRLVAALGVTDAKPRTWSDSEVEVIRETAERVWSAAELARASQALRESEAALRQSEATLRAADQRKNEFLGILAHELRNPLAPIHNGVRLLEAGVDPARVPLVITMMKRQVGQMVRLIDDLIDVSRVSQGKVELQKTRCDLDAVIRLAVEANQPLRERLEHKLMLVKSGRPAYVFADAARLTQVIGNLLNNACKFTDKGGQIFLSVQHDADHVVVRVRDTGIGMTPDKIPALFELFSQADTSLARTESGLGIGLAVVKRLVEMHGGTIEASSPGLGHGSEFVVRLPLYEETFISVQDRPSTGFSARPAPH